ncbi:hypothetical protein EMCRGX_G032381 [Ephydatia muelleri]
MSAGSFGKGKRRFAPQGAWRSSSSGEDADPVVWLPPDQHGERPHIPTAEAGASILAAAKKPKHKNQLYLAELAMKFWGPQVPPEQRTFSPQLVEDIYRTLTATNFASRPVMALEYSQYLENCLWPNFEPTKTTPAHLMSIVLMVNEKFKERVPAWEAFEGAPEHFAAFFQHVTAACVLDLKGGVYSMKERTLLILFLIHCFNSLEVDIVREELQQLVSLSTWHNLIQSRLELELKNAPKLKKYWSAVQKKEKQLDAAGKEKAEHNRMVLWRMMQQFLEILESIPAEGDVDEDAVSYCERFLELLTDLEAQLPTRRFFNTLLDAAHVLVRCELAKIIHREPEGHLCKQLLERVKFYAGFEINDQTGTALTDHKMTEHHYDKIISLQKAAFKLFPQLKPFSLSNVASVDTRESLRKHFGALDNKTLHEIAAHLSLVPSPSIDDGSATFTSAFLLELLICHHERRSSQLEAINSMPLYPTEDVLWDENVVPSEYYNGETCLALPKLNLQFLTLHDYLLRNLLLFRLESTYEIREDIEDALSRMKPWITTEGNTEFAGWARMALPITTFAVIEVGRPNVGENRPSRVRADVSVNLRVGDSVKHEWENLRKHDVCFLMTVRAQMNLNQGFDWSKPFVPQVGLVYVRGCEVEGMLDDQGKLIEEGPGPKPVLTKDERVFRVWLDTNQYQKDMELVVKGDEDIYTTFNIFMRRKPKENNFKAVLESIRALMNTECVVPNWLHDVFLGYGDPAAAHYKRMPNQLRCLDFKDTFLSFEHVKASFPMYEIQCTTEDALKQVPPFRVIFPEERSGVKRKHPDTSSDLPPTTAQSEDSQKATLIVEPYVIPNRGPYPYNQPKRNTVPFTPTQVEAIRSGMQPGLTMVVGPPGTGKTDVAVQIISNLYHNFPEERILLVTHSNQALNQLFEKIMALDIEERHLLRLGHGEEELQTEKDFSRYGRVNFILSMRLELLKEVERMKDSFGVSGDVAYTCETAGHFFLYQVHSRWEQFVAKVKHLAGKPEGVKSIQECFPFREYFSTAPQPLFKGASFEQDWDIAEGCWRHIKRIFKHLEEFRAFELLRTGRDRIHFLMTKEAKIIALTCTHAALKRKDMVDLMFRYDSVLMEEAAQILEVETFIPLMLQNPQDGSTRLKRVVLIGDHHQLPPVIKNMSFQKYSNMEQSLFARFVRLGVPPVQLDAQGRARPSLCDLYNWRYKLLGNLPHVLTSSEYQYANPGFCYDYQLINVEDLNGIGESEPTPHFYQNLAEAEYAVSVFMFMRLQGYPPDKIAILTTYNGQKHLIRDVLAKRCARNPVFGLPEKVTTVDRYQGQQNDYIILSLVRTKHVGHLRDVRRLVVAMSRARLGLYVLARVALFRGCTELEPTFKLLMQRPLELHLVPEELYPPSRPYQSPPSAPVFVVGSMPQLAEYVYQDYTCRINALKTRQLALQEEQRVREEEERKVREEEERKEQEERRVREEEERKEQEEQRVREEEERRVREEEERRVQEEEQDEEREQEEDEEEQDASKHARRIDSEQQVESDISGDERQQEDEERSEKEPSGQRSSDSEGDSHMETVT